jgi:hypothetical protein
MARNPLLLAFALTVGSATPQVACAENWVETDWVEFDLDSMHRNDDGLVVYRVRDRGWGDTAAVYSFEAVDCVKRRWLFSDDGKVWTEQYKIEGEMAGLKLKSVCPYVAKLP